MLTTLAGDVAQVQTSKGPGWEGVYLGVDADGGWPLYLNRYAALITS